LSDNLISTNLLIDYLGLPVPEGGVVPAGV